MHNGREVHGMRRFKASHTRIYGVLAVTSGDKLLCSMLSAHKSIRMQVICRTVFSQLNQVVRIPTRFMSCDLIELQMFA